MVKGKVNPFSPSKKPPPKLLNTLLKPCPGSQEVGAHLALGGIPKRGTRVALNPILNPALKRGKVRPKT